MIFDQVKAYAAIAAALALGAVAAVQTVRLHTAQLDAANSRTANARTLAHIADLTTKALLAVRNQETAWATAQERNDRETASQIAAAQADADGARRASDGLRQRIASLVAEARGRAAGAGAAPAVEATGDPIGVLADVLGRADERAGILAAYADKARIAGQSCERDYDALTEPPRPAAGSTH
ncbi:hypothetical protein ASF19_20230 [Acidovorax sp. Leaf84]|uniref:DUF2514 family protein n=1 Tax=Acidovorax sp. Leaf84 TaxID=1736240 RepID=UPI0006FA612A|nr:DUF2514 family protein [Acidovorax sp. Leaf84]KQO38105.1 hypothetical protein ASF19_20230 [Acidovorax sp. Leaf84]